MLNPMTYDFVRAAAQRYPEPLANVISAVDHFAYGVSWPIETFMGEYSGNLFDAERLRKAIQKSIWDDSDFYSRGAHSFFVPVFNASGLAPSARKRIFQIVEDESFLRISQAIRRDENGTETFCEHGHHGRQYIARNATARFVKEVLPPLSRVLPR